MRILQILTLLFLPLHNALCAEVGFKSGSEGFLVEELNQKLQSTLGSQAEVASPIDAFGIQTTRNIQLLYKKDGKRIPEEIIANNEVYMMLDLKFPDELTRCIQFVNNYEGTEHTIQGDKESGDTKPGQRPRPKVTYGIVGFTSHDGSLQWFLWHINDELNGALVSQVNAHLGADRAKRFEKLISIGSDKSPYENSDAVLVKANREFVDWALDDGRAKQDVVDTFFSFDEIQDYRMKHRELCIRKEWEFEGEPNYCNVYFKKYKHPSAQVKLFCIDITVLTNGPDRKQVNRLLEMSYSSEKERMRQIIEAMQESKSYEGKEDDSVKRLTCIMTGNSPVHGTKYDITAYAIPLSTN